jgi:hypothetical protein
MADFRNFAFLVGAPDLTLPNQKNLKICILQHLGFVTLSFKAIDSRDMPKIRVP